MVPLRLAIPAGTGLQPLGWSQGGGTSERVNSLISSLIHLRPPGFISVYPMSVSSPVDLRGRSCTVILNPEKRKVGGSTPPLTTSSPST
jgi:hypothetical protein